MKTCKHCGAGNPDELRVCAYCGKELDEEEKKPRSGLLGSMGRKRYAAPEAGESAPKAEDAAPAEEPKVEDAAPTEEPKAAEDAAPAEEPKAAEDAVPAEEPQTSEGSSVRKSGGLAGRMGKVRYESKDEGKPAEKEAKPEPSLRKDTGLAGKMGDVRYGTKPKDSPPAALKDTGLAGKMGEVRYGTKPKDSPEEPRPAEPEKKKRPDKGVIVAVSLAVLAAAASVLLVFWDAIFGSAQLYGAGIGGYINYYRPVEEEEIVEEDGVRYVGDQMLIVSAFGASYEEMETFFEERDMEIIGYVELIDTYQVQLDKSYTLSELHTMASELEKDRLVDSATVNTVRENADFSIPSDPWDGNSNWDEPNPYSGNWGVVAIHAPEAWERWEPSVVRVGVLDSMFDEGNRDLNIVMTRGNEVYDRTPNNDDKAHGTHVSGTIGAIHDNGYGVAGVAENCEIYGYSASRYRTTMDEVSAMAELAAQDVRVINYSMGLIDEYRDAAIERNGVERDIYYHYAAAFSQTAMKHLLRKGYDFILVCAAGNDPVEAKWASEYAYITDPMIRDRIIVVGAAEVDRDGHYSLTYFSARGERMDVVAPGMDIYSTMPGGGFDYMSGTSMATPHVTGVTASVWAIAPNLSGAEVKRIVVSTATTPVAGTDVGMINMEAAMAAAEAAAR